MDEGRKRVLAIVAGILVARRLKTADDLFVSLVLQRLNFVFPIILGFLTCPKRPRKHVSGSRSGSPRVARRSRKVNQTVLRGNAGAMWTPSF